MDLTRQFDAIVIGGGPSGATAAEHLAKGGFDTLLLDRGARTKPCGGAIPPKLIGDFDIPDELLVARINTARMISPASVQVDIPIEDGFVGMVDREVFDEWLRQRAVSAGATLVKGTYLATQRDAQDAVQVRYRMPDGGEDVLRARCLIGADGARSRVARDNIENGDVMPYVIAYHEIVASPSNGTGDYDGTRCDVYYNGELSPDFYGWVFPHGKTASVGMGTAQTGFDLKDATRHLREVAGLSDVETVRREGAPIPLKPLANWDNGRDIIVAGDAAGVVAPSSGEGIYYAMLSGRMVAEATEQFLLSGNPRKLKAARKRFMRLHGGVFWILGIMQKYWYINDKRRERFVRICKDRDVQKLTFDAYMNKELVKARPAAHARIFFKNIVHLTGVAPV